MAQYYKPSLNSKSDSFIKDIQIKLNAIRLQYHGNWDYLIPDGIYGPKTGNAVRSFQILKNITPASGELGPTTTNYILHAYNNVPKITNASYVLRDTPKKSKSKVNEIIDNSSNAASLGALLLDGSLPWIKHLIEVFPQVFYKIKNNPKAPLFVFSKNDAYHKWGNIYNRVDIRNIGDTVPDYLSKVAFICQLLTIKSKIDEYRAGNFEWNRFLKFGGEITSFVTSGTDILVKQFPRLSRLGYAAADTGAAVSLGTGATLSTIGQAIGAFLLGWEIGKLIGKIPCGNGKNVQYYIDQYIDMIWEHPYKTIGLVPSGGLVIAAGIDTWKRAIEWNVNKVSNLKPLTDSEKKKLEQYLMQHREMYIQTAPPKCFIYSTK